MEYAIIAIGISIYIWRYTRKPSYRFWRSVSRRPDSEYDRFLEDETWRVFENRRDPNLRHLQADQAWSGPFTFFFPKLGKMVWVMGKFSEIEEYQRKHLEILDLFESCRPR